MGRTMKQIFGALILLILSLTCVAQTGDKTSNARASGEQRGEGRRIGGRGIGGTIEEIKSDSFTVKTMDGKTVAVKVTPETQFRKDRQEAKFSDFKAGDFVMIGGEPNGQDAFTARFVASRPGGGA